MGWACENCGHAPHGSGLKACKHEGAVMVEGGKGGLRCGCDYVTDREARRHEIQANHAAVDRNPEYGSNVRKYGGTDV